MKTINNGDALNKSSARKQTIISSEDHRRIRQLNSVLRQMPKHLLEGKDAEGTKIHLFPHLFTIAVGKAFPALRVVHEAFNKRGAEKFRSWLLTPEGSIIDLFSGQSCITGNFEESRIYSRDDPFYCSVPPSRVLMIEGRLLGYDGKKNEIVEDIKTVLLELQKRR